MTEEPLHAQLTNLTIDPSISHRVQRINELTIADIDKLKKEIEFELDQNFSVLNDQNLTLESSLLTRDGYPRSDIDVLQVRLVRRNIHMLKNDLKRVIDVSFTKLNQHFAGNEEKFREAQSIDVAYIIPFAVVDEIVEDGPMFRCGCLKNDKLILIGNLNAGNYLNLQNISRYIIQSENKKISIKVQRNDEFLTLTLVPTRNWVGQGLLGCKFKLL